MNRQKLLQFIVVALTVIAIPLTIYMAQRQQEIRQQASTSNANVYFAMGGTTTEITQPIRVAPGGTFPIDVYIDPGTMPVNGFDVTFSWGGWLALSNLVEGEGAASFEEIVGLNFQASQFSKTVHFVKVNRAGGVSGKIKIISTVFVAQENAPSTSGQISFGQVTVTSPQSEDNIGSAGGSVTYVISSAQPTSPGGNLTKTPTMVITRPPVNTQTPTGIPSNTIAPTRSITPTTPPIGGISPTARPNQPTATTKPGSPTPTSARQSPAPTDSGGTGKHTRFDFHLVLQAIGPLSVPIGNQNPKTREKQLKIEVFNKYDPSTPILTKIGTIVYDSNSGCCEGEYRALVDMGNTLSTGDYIIKVKTEKYLRKLIQQGVVHVTAGETNKMPPGSGMVLALTVGDINNDNMLNIEDYNIYLSCFGNKSSNKILCPDKDIVDLNDDGKTDTPTDLTDYRWLFESFRVQFGD